MELPSQQEEKNQPQSAAGQSNPEKYLTLLKNMKLVGRTWYALVKYVGTNNNSESHVGVSMHGEEGHIILLLTYLYFI